MCSARRFRFFTLPLVGFYANGEVGPMAMAEQQGSVFQSGRVALQGFTAVFGLFVTPERSTAAADLATLDASPAQLRQYMSSRRRCPEFVG